MEVLITVFINTSCMNVCLPLVVNLATRHKHLFLLLIFIFHLSHFLHSALKQAESQQNLNSSGRFSGLSANTITQSELDALVAQNENLKSSLEKLRKNTAQVSVCACLCV